MTSGYLSTESIHRSPVPDIGHTACFEGFYDLSLAQEVSEVGELLSDSRKGNGGIEFVATRIAEVRIREIEYWASDWHSYNQRCADLDLSRLIVEWEGSSRGRASVRYSCWASFSAALSSMRSRVAVQESDCDA